MRRTSIAENRRKPTAIMPQTPNPRPAPESVGAAAADIRERLRRDHEATLSDERFVEHELVEALFAKLARDKLSLLEEAKAA